VKISDFGLARDVEMDNYYQSSNKDIPYKWCSPEVLLHGKFSQSSDIWAFGIVLWEIFTWGDTPYPGLPNQMMIEKVVKGSTMEIPEDFPPEITEIIQQCWKFNHNERPSAEEILNKIQPTHQTQDVILTESEMKDLGYQHQDEMSYHQ